MKRLINKDPVLTELIENKLIKKINFSLEDNRWKMTVLPRNAKSKIDLYDAFIGLVEKLRKQRPQDILEFVHYVRTEETYQRHQWYHSGDKRSQTKVSYDLVITEEDIYFEESQQGTKPVFVLNS